MGCIISKKKSLKRQHHHHHQHQQRKESSEKRSSRINSSRIDDSSQSKEEQEDRSSCRDDAKVEFSSSRFSEKHPEISEIGDTDEDEDEDTTTPHEELKREPSVAEQVAAGWPAWLVSVAGEALVDWTPRRASTFEKLEKVISMFCFFFLLFFEYLGVQMIICFYFADWSRHL